MVKSLTSNQTKKHIKTANMRRKICCSGKLSSWWTECCKIRLSVKTFEGFNFIISYTLDEWCFTFCSEILNSDAGIILAFCICT